MLPRPRPLALAGLAGATARAVAMATMATMAAMATIVAACGNASDDGMLADNLPPEVTSVSVAGQEPAGSIGVIVPIDRPVAFVATASDPDGAVARYRWRFADGSAEVVTATGDLEHTFAGAGVYEVEVVAVDDRGAEATGMLIVAVDAEPAGE